MNDLLTRLSNAKSALAFLARLTLPVSPQAALTAALREIENLGGTDGYYCFYLDGLSKENQDTLKGA